MKARIAGGAALTLVFIATLSFTWVYLKDGSAEVAAAAQSVPSTPLADPDAFVGITLSGKSAIVVDIDNGRTLYALHPDAQWPLASLTKVALTLAVVDALDPHTSVTIPFDTGYNSHAKGELGEGQTWRLQDVIDFTLAVSSNTGADILATLAAPAIERKYPLAPIEGTTVWRMNDLVRSLGLDHTYFLNDNGLDI